jgi:hypothetical protein
VGAAIQTRRAFWRWRMDTAAYTKSAASLCDLSERLTYPQKKHFSSEIIKVDLG